MAMGTVACNSGSRSASNVAGSSSQQSSGQTNKKLLKASIEKPIVEIGKRTKVISEVEGVTFRSSDEEIATVDAEGNLKAVEMGMAYITVSKEGYFDRVLKFFVDEYETVDYLVEGLEIGPAIVGVKLNLDGLVKK